MTGWGGSLWGLYGVLWGSVGSKGFYEALWGLIGVLWVLWGFMGSLWGSMSSMGFYGFWGGPRGDPKSDGRRWVMGWGGSLWGLYGVFMGFCGF